jgi:hypothetical protein
MKVYTPNQLRKMTKGQLRGVLRDEHNIDLDPDPGVTQVMLVADVLAWQEKAMIAPEAPEIEPAPDPPHDVEVHPEIEPSPPVGDHPISSPDTIQALPERILCVGMIPRKNRIPAHRCDKDTMAADECFIVYIDPQKAASPLLPPVDYILENAYCSGCLQKLLRTDPSVAYRQITLVVKDEVKNG